MRTFRSATVLLGILAFAACARAEKSDREKEINVGADTMTADDRNRTSAFEGNVIITQGTMRITAAKVTVREDAEGYRFYVAVGNPVTFRQKRDKVEDYIEGFAQRTEFDDKSDMLKLHDRARLKSGQGEIAGEIITYDMNRELFQVSGAAGTQNQSASRVKATLMPTKKGSEAGKDAKTAPNPPVTLKPDALPGSTE
jgi:lipopolysaccharide export system protein LptA